MPPLRERREDILPLARAFLRHVHGGGAAPPPRDLSPRRRARWSSTTGPATCASCATRSSGSRSCGPAPSSSPRRCPGACRAAPHRAPDGGRRLLDRRDRTRAHPVGARARPQDGGRGGAAGDRRLDAVAQAQEVRGDLVRAPAARAAEAVPRVRGRGRQDLPDAGRGARAEGARRRRRAGACRDARARRDRGAAGRTGASCRAGRFEYRGVVIEEMDLDAVLERRPEVAVVDEIAHTNVPGSRHRRRYQDVLALLDAGINVDRRVQHPAPREPERRRRARDRRGDPRDGARQLPQAGRPGRQPGSAASKTCWSGCTPARSTPPSACPGRCEHFFKDRNLATLRELALREVAESLDRDERRRRESARDADPGDDGRQRPR